MRLASLHRRIAELERQIIGKLTILRLPNGRSFTIPHKGELRMFCRAMDLCHQVYVLPPDELAKLELPADMAALVDAEIDPEWPPLLLNARGFLTGQERYSGRDQVLKFLRRKGKKHNE